MTLHTVYADFNNADPRGRVRLNGVGTIRDLAEKGITLTEGLRLILADDEVAVECEVRFAPEERLWVAILDWEAMRQRSA